MISDVHPLHHQATSNTINYYYIYVFIYLEMSADAGKDSPDTNGVILLGENHGDDLGKAISEALDEFFKSQQNQQYNKIGCFREDVQPQVVELRLQTLRGQLTKMPVLPLEPPEGEIIHHANLYDSFIPKSLPYVMSSVYPLLEGLSKLFMYIAFGEAKVDSVAVSRNAAAGTPVQRVCREIQSEFEDVILTTNPLKYNAFRESMKVLFPNEKEIIVSLQNYQTPENTAKFIELYNIVYDYYSLLISQNPQYAEFALRRKELTLPDGKGVQDVVFPDDSTRLMRFLRSERDELMVQKLTDYMRDDPQPKRVNVVVVGNDHVANMTRLLKVPPFKLLQVKSTQLKPQKGALVRTHSLSKEELNGKYGIVTNPNVVDSGGSIRTQVFLKGMKVVDSTGSPQRPLGLKRENFEVIELEPRPEVIKTILGSADVVDYVKSMGGSKRYKKCSKRRCYARMRKGKRSKRRSAKKY